MNLKFKNFGLIVIKSVFNGIVSFALPPVCFICCEILPEGSRFVCTACHDKLIPFTDIHPWKDEEISSGRISSALSLYSFIEGTEIQTLLHSLKYEKMRSIGRMFGREIGRRIQSQNDVSYDFTVPVPLHKAKERERTFNQSHWICRGISDELNIPLLDNCLKRTRFTATQTHLHRGERKKNVHGAFVINPKFTELIRSKNIILADDVITTGSTILECAGVLKAAGCRSVAVCSIAYAVLD